MSARLGDDPPRWTRDFEHNGMSWREYAYALTKRQIRGIRRIQVNRDNTTRCDIGGSD